MPSVPQETRAIHVLHFVQSCNCCFQSCALPCRFIQLPVNLGMPEAWQGSGHTWSSQADALGGSGNGSVMAAAARMGVGVFGSAPLQEGQLLQHSSKLLVSYGRC